MTTAASAKTLAPTGPMAVSQRMRTAYAILIFIGLAGTALGLLREPTRAWHAYLIGLFYFTSISLGGLFFAAIQHMTRAGWSVTVRRLAESFTAFLPVAAVGALIYRIFGARFLYIWLDAGTVAGDENLQHKAGYLNGTFFWIRLILFFGLWMLFAKMLVGDSIAQDKSGDENLTKRAVGRAIAFIAVFALSYSFFSVDMMMSLDPHWFSTIFGVYCFSGLFQSTLAMLILVVLRCMNKGLLTGYVDDNHLHDLGKFLLAFTIFWAYIAFSQFMLMWYANLPEETTFFIPRSEGSWAVVSLVLIVGKFVVPFLALLPKWAKRNSPHLAAVCWWILIMQFVDLYWLVYPSFKEHEVVFGLTEIAPWLCFFGLFLFTTTRFLSKNPIVANRDPRLAEAIHHHVTY